MAFFSGYKSTVFIWFLVLSACGSPQKKEKQATEIAEAKEKSTPVKPVVIGANQTEKYLSYFKSRSIGIVANQTSVIFKSQKSEAGSRKSGIEDDVKNNTAYTHLVDSLLALKVQIKKVFAPEHGFRGQADAGEKVKDGVDIKTGLPLISLYGKNRKPSAEQLKGLDVVLFDIQDVGVRFYTYIATLQLVMEACAENNIPIIVLDRPNPNAHYVDGPTMQMEHTGFLGMTEIPLVYGMTIGEYAKMINEEGLLTGGVKANLTVIPLQNWKHTTPYNLTIRPSPNLPNDQAINLYPSLGLFEGTNVNAGRGSEFQFQRYGASFLDSTQYSFSYTPRPNFGSKNPKEKGEICFGKDLSEISKMSQVSLQWLIDAYKNSMDKSKFFNTNGFTKHAGTEILQQQIEDGLTEKEIKSSWQTDLEKFKKIREKYLLYN